MARPRKPRISPRKAPTQRRSKQLVADILEAAIRVLKKDGARRFTTIRVAQTAGISVGSLYQYFPNKEAILFRLQADEWEATWAGVRQRLFADGQPEARLRAALRYFFQTEVDEAELRVALADASGLIREAHETQELMHRAQHDLRRFVAELAPTASRADRAFAAELALVSFGAIAEHCSEAPPATRALHRWADATAAMIAGWVTAMGRC